MGKKYVIAAIVILAFTMSFAALPNDAKAEITQTLGEFTFVVDKETTNVQETTMNASNTLMGKDKRSEGKKPSKSSFALKTFDDNNQCMATGYSIQVINGKNRGEDRISSAKIILNDRVLYRQSDFNQQPFKSTTAPLDKDLIKATGNELKVLVNGKPGAFITVGIYGEYSGTGSGGGVPGALYLDKDGDGYGSTPICMPAEQECFDFQSVGVDYFWVPDGGDCDEADPLVNPSVAGSCPACW